MNGRVSGFALDRELRTEAFLDVRGIAAGYDSVPFIADVSISVARGEISLVIGPNGSGKSTLLKAIMGELPLLAGNIFFDGKDVSTLSEDRRISSGIGYVPQSRDVFPTLSVQENLEMGGFRLDRRIVPTRVREVFDLFPQLFPLRRRLARTLSGGERKMLGIGRSLVADPQLLILDEPTSNLSPHLAEQFLANHVKGLAEQSRAVLLVEQRVDLSMEIASWVYGLVAGRRRYSGPATEFNAVEDIGSLLLGAASGSARRPDNNRESKEDPIQSSSETCKQTGNT